MVSPLTRTSPSSPLEDRLGQMGRIPARGRLAESWPQLRHDGLGQQGERHVAVSNVEVKGPGAVPAESLFGVEELFGVPTLGEVLGQGGDFLAVGGGQEGVELPLFGSFPETLDELNERPASAPSELVRPFGGGVAGPVTGERLGRHGAQLPLEGRLVGHGHQQVEGGLFVNVIEQLGCEMFRIGQDERFVGLGLEDVRGEFQQLGHGLRNGA